MKRRTLALMIAAALMASACLVTDTTSTMYLRQDGSFDWVILEQNVRSDERTEASRLAEEARYVDGVSGGDTDIVNGLLALGAEDVQVQWLRSRRPYAVMVDGQFDSLAKVLDRALAPCGIPYESRMTESEGVVTWTLRADVGLDGERLDAADADDCGRELGGLIDAFEDLRIILESESFTAATGFTLSGSDTAVIDEAGIEESARRTGIVELSLSWR